MRLFPGIAIGKRCNNFTVVRARQPKLLDGQAVGHQMRAPQIVVPNMQLVFKGITIGRGQVCA